MVKGIGWRIFLGYAALIVPLALAFTLLFEHRRERERLTELQGVYAPLAQAVERARGLGGVETALSEVAAFAAVDAAYIGSGGEVTANYSLTGDARAELRSFPEVRSALGGEASAAFRFSNLLKRDAYFVGLPAGDGVLHLVVAPDRLDPRDGGSNLPLVAGAVAVALAAAGILSFFLHNSIVARLSSLSRYLEEVRGRFFPPSAQRGAGDAIDRAGAEALSIADGLTETITMLAEEKEKVGAIVQHMEDGVALLDGETRILLANTAFLGMFDLDAAGAAGRRIGEAVRNPALLDMVAVFGKNGKSAKREIAIGVSPALHVLASIAPLAAAHSRPRGLLMLHDVTQQKKLEEMRVDFVANASHELKTPLTAIRGFIETLNDGEEHGREESAQFMGIIERQAERLGRLIDDLLTLSDIELGKEKLEFTPLAPASVIKGAEQVVANSAAQRRVSLSHDVADDVGAVEADRDRLLQILLNLLDNAIKYTPPGGRVETRCRKLVVDGGSAGSFGYPSLDGNPLLPEADGPWRREFAEFAVSDTGEGIPASSLPRLMERFYRVDKARSRERGGTGLGLSIVKHIVIAHQGSIRIESEMGKGTTVFFVIPLRRPA